MVAKDLSCTPPIPSVRHGVRVGIAAALLTLLAACGGGGSAATDSAAAVQHKTGTTTTPAPVGGPLTPTGTDVPGTAASVVCAASVAGDGVVPYPTDTAAYPLTNGLYERPETSVTLLGTNDGVANSYTEPFPGALGGRYLLFFNTSHVTLTGKGYVLFRWEYAYFNRGGVISPANAPTAIPMAGSFVKKVAATGQFMPDPYIDGMPGASGVWRPGTQNYIPITITGDPTAVPTGYQNEYYYIDGTVTFANHENGLDYNVALTPVTAAQMRSDVAATKVGAAFNVARPALLLDPYDGSSKPASPTLLTASVVSDSKVALTWSDCASTEKGYLVEMSYAGDFGDPGKTKAYALGDLYALAGSFPANTTSATIATLLPSTHYLMRVKAYDAAGDSAYSNTVDFTTPATSPLPQPYLQADVTATTLATPGTASASNGSFAVRAATGNISGTSDSFTFVYRAMTGDGTFTARVAGLAYITSGSKAGVMIRDGLNADATYAMTEYLPSFGVSAQRRGGPGGTTAQEGSDPASFRQPWWIRIIRKGSVFTMQSSPDGATWTTLSNRAITMGATVQVGLVAASVSDRVVTATYDNVSLTQP